MQMTPTTRNCCVRLVRRLSTTRSISAVRSYATTISTPSGRPFRISASSRLDVVDDLPRVGSVADDDDPSDRLALAVPVGQAAPDLRPETDARDVLHEDGSPRPVDAERDLADVVERFDVPEAADHELLLRDLQQPPARVAVTVLNGLSHSGNRNAVGAEPVRIDGDLVLAHEAADARHLGHAPHARQLVLEEPVLDRTQLAEVVPVRPESVHECPTHTRGVRAECRRDARRQVARDVVQRFEDAAARPVRIRAVLEDHVDEREAEERVPAHDARARHRQQLGGERVGDLVLDDARRLARILAIYDHLDVRKIGNGVERRLRQRKHTGRGYGDGRQHHQKPVTDGPVDDAVEHGQPVIQGSRTAPPSRSRRIRHRCSAGRQATGRSPRGDCFRNRSETATR